MIPILYKPDESNFDFDGIGSLTDALACTVTEERNGPYELEMTYPIGGQLYDSIKNQCIIKAKPNDTANLQLFRVYKVTKPINQICTVYAEHISYELAGNPVLDFNCSGNAGVVLSTLLDRAIFAHKFTAASDITGSNTVKFAGPHNVREIMGGTDGSVLDTFGGEYEWDNYTITLHAHRGRDNGVTVEYGKNLTDLTQEETIDSTYTCVVPYAKTSSDGVDTYRYLSSKYVNAPNADKFARPKALMVDFSDKFNTDSSENNEKPTFSESLLQQYAEQYILANNVGVPKVALTIKYVPLWMLPEYAGNPLLERVSLCDTVTVRFERLGVDAKARVNKITYNVLQERVEEAELGDAKSNFVDSYTQLQQQIAKVPQSVQSLIDGAVSKATGLITGAKGGHVVIKTDADKKPQEILIMDTEDINTAVHVWRWNINGFGYSGSGINGPYETAITMDGHILGKFIYALTIYGDQIVAGVITSADGRVKFDLDGGTISTYDSGGKLTSRIDSEAHKYYEAGTEVGGIKSNNEDRIGTKRWVNIYAQNAAGVCISPEGGYGTYFGTQIEDGQYSLMHLGYAKFAKGISSDGMISTPDEVNCGNLKINGVEMVSNNGVNVPNVNASGYVNANGSISGDTLRITSGADIGCNHITDSYGITTDKNISCGMDAAIGGNMQCRGSATMAGATVTTNPIRTSGVGINVGGGDITVEGGNITVRDGTITCAKLIVNGHEII